MPPRILVSYSYHETHQPRYHTNVKFFLREALERFPSDSVDYLFVIQGHECSVKLPEDHPRVTVLRTDNSGFDLGGHGKGIRHLLDDTEQLLSLPYDYYIFLNGGQRGPFLPSYWPQDQHWTRVFLNRFHHHRKPGVVGATMFQHPKLQKPVVETWCMALTASCFWDVWEHVPVFELHRTKKQAVVNGEDVLGPFLHQQGYTVDCLLYKYRDGQEDINVDIPSRPFGYDSINIHPLETVFHKTYWQSGTRSENGYECPFEQRYTEWALGHEPQPVTAQLDPRRRPRWGWEHALTVAILSALLMAAVAWLIVLITGRRHLP